MRHARIAVLDEHYAPVWTGSLYAFVKANGLDRAEVARLILLARSAPAPIGGRCPPLLRFSRRLDPQPQPLRKTQ